MRVRHWRRLGLVGLFAAGVAGPTFAQPPLNPAAVPAPGPSLNSGESVIDLATALRLAGVQNPQLLLARERVTEALAVRQLVAAQALPNVNAGLNYDLHRGPLQQAAGNVLNVNRDALYVGLGANAVGAGTVNVPGVSYNVNPVTGRYDYLRAKQLVARAAAAARTSENDTLLRVCLAYTESVRAEARVAVVRQNRAEAAELVRLTTAYAKAGQGRQADADRATVELRKRDADAAQADADAAIAAARLGQLLSLDPAVRLRPADTTAVPIAAVPDPVPVADLVAIALMMRPELEERRAEIRESVYALSSAKVLPFSPTVVLGFSTGSFGGGSDLVSQGPAATGPRFGDFGGRVDFDAAVVFTLQNLGVGNVAQVRGAASRARQADFRRQETFNRVRAEVVEADARTRARLKQIDAAADAVAAGRAAYAQDLARIKGREGLPIEVIDSLRLLARARNEYLDAITEYNRSQFQLYVAIGRPPADALARPAPPPATPVAK